MVRTFSSESLSKQDNAELWWNEISLPLRALMQSAGYSVKRQEHYAEFINQYVVPSLGPHPNINASGTRLPHFDSFCNDDFSPVEFSWNVGPEKSMIRVGFEPIGSFAGTRKDPFNQREPREVISSLLRYGGGQIDKQLWDFFDKHLCVDDKCADDIISEMAPDEHLTTRTISFDLKGELPVPKTYFYTVPISRQENKPASKILVDAIRKLPLNLAPSLSYILDFLSKKQLDQNPPRLELLALDAVHPTESRFKLYLRSKETCLARVEEIYTLGGTLKGHEIDGGLDLIRLFYLYVFGVSARGDNLPHSEHLTAGIGYNMEIKHNAPAPTPKVYIPVRHYGGTDLRTAQLLSSFFSACGIHHMADTYVGAVQQAFPTQDFSKTIGRQTYVALSYNKDGPYVTIYYNTMIFSVGSERNRDGRLVGPAAKKPRHRYN